MKPLTIRGLATVLLVMAGSALASAAEPDGGAKPGRSPASAEGGTWFQRWFGPGEKPPAAKPVIRIPEEEQQAEETPALPANQVDEAAAAREKEMQALFRRQMVCLKLMRIALESNDEELLRKAEQLDERARSIYTQRTAHLPGRSFESDEETLKRHLGRPDTAVRHSERSPRRPASEASLREEFP
jgi:hypothetical protein